MLCETFEIQLLTGFLGSGKTTLLKTFIESLEAKDVGVVVNEIGEIDVDGAVLTQSATSECKPRPGLYRTQCGLTTPGWSCSDPPQIGRP